MLAAPLPSLGGGPGGYRHRVLTGAERDDDADVATLADQRDRHVERAFCSDPEGLRAAWSTYGDLVYGFCTRALGPERALDATQEVFITAWRRRDAYDPDRGALVAWLMGIARHKVMGVMRSEGRHPAPSDPELLPEGAAEDDVDLLADRMLVAHALEALSDSTRTCVRLAVMDGLSHREVAARTGLPLGTVKSHVRRGLERLRRAMEGSDDH